MLTWCKQFLVLKIRILGQVLTEPVQIMINKVMGLNPGYTRIKDSKFA